MSEQAQENVELLRETIDRWNRREVSLSAFHTDVEWLPMRVATEGVYRGIAGIERFLADTEQVFDKFELRFELLDQGGEQVLAWGTIHVRARSSGIETDIAIGGVAEFREGRIVRWEDFGSKDKALQAIGQGGFAHPHASRSPRGVAGGRPVGVSRKSKTTGGRLAPVPIRGIDHVDLAVADVQRSLDFYLEIFGPLGADVALRYSTYRGTEEVVYLRLGEQYLGFRSADGGQYRYYDVGVEHLAVTVDSRAELDGCYERCQKIDANIQFPPEEDRDIPGVWEMFVFDPDGMRVEVAYYPPDTVR